MKALESLKFYTFTIRRVKTNKKYASLRHWAKQVKRSVLSALKAYSKYKQHKKQLYKQVLTDRERHLKQQMVFKICKVGQYW